jgi:hypothetical protein
MTSNSLNILITVDLLNPKQDEVVVNKDGIISHSQAQILFFNYVQATPLCGILRHGVAAVQSRFHGTHGLIT